MRQGALKKSYLQGAFARPSHHMKRNCSELLTFKHTGFQMSNTISEAIVIPIKYKKTYRKSLDPLPPEWDNFQNSKDAANGGSIPCCFLFYNYSR